MLDGVLHRLLELLLDLVETTDVLPLDGGDLDDGLAKGRRVGRAESKAEVLHRNSERVENFGVNGILIEVNEIHLLADLLHGGLGTQRSKI